MNRTIFLVGALNGLGFFSPVFSSDLVQFPSGPAAWTVEITYQDASSSGPAAPAPASPNASPHPTKAEITLVNDIRRMHITWSNGKTTDRWSLASRGLTITDNPTNNSIYVISDNNSILLSYGKVVSDASDFKWLNPGMLVSPDPVTYQEKSCLHYKGVVPLPMPGQTMKAEAWVDKSTFLPVALQEANALYVFTFLPPPPSTPLVMPPNFQAALNRVIATTTPPKVVGGYR